MSRWPSRSLSNAIRWPAPARGGSHEGLPSRPAALVSRVSPEPSAFIANTSVLAPRVLSNAMRSAGSVAWPWAVATTSAAAATTPAKAEALRALVGPVMAAHQNYEVLIGLATLQRADRRRSSPRRI